MVRGSLEKYSAHFCPGNGRLPLAHYFLYPMGVRSINQFFNCSISFCILARQNYWKQKLFQNTFPPVISLRNIVTSKILKVWTSFIKFKGGPEKGTREISKLNAKHYCERMSFSPIASSKMDTSDGLCSVTPRKRYEYRFLGRTSVSVGLHPRWKFGWTSID